MSLDNVDLVVVGAGPAGMAAAISARECGVQRVIIAERAEQIGGLLHQCIHNGFGLQYYSEDLTGPEYARRMSERVSDLGIDVLTECMVTGISPELVVSAVTRRHGYVRLKPKAVVLSMGCRERTRDAIGIPGTRPAGVLTAGTAQRYINVEGFLPGRKVVILGSGDVGMIMARRLTLEGAEVLAVLEILPYVGGLIRNEVQCIHDFGIPLLLGHTVTEIHGQRHIEAVTIAKVDENMQVIPETSRVLECDALLLSVGLIPENELSSSAGVVLDPRTGGPVVTETRETSVRGIFAAGNVAHVHDLVDNVSWEGELAGSNAAKVALGSELPRSRIRLVPGENLRYVVPQTISGEGDVTLYMRVKRPEQKVSIKVGNFFEKILRVVEPGVMVKLEIAGQYLRSIPEETEEITVDCVPRTTRRNG